MNTFEIVNLTNQAGWKVLEITGEKVTVQNKKRTTRLVVFSDKFGGACLESGPDGNKRHPSISKKDLLALMTPAGPIKKKPVAKKEPVVKKEAKKEPVVKKKPKKKTVAKKKKVGHGL